MERIRVKMVKTNKNEKQKERGQWNGVEQLYVYIKKGGAGLKRRKKSRKRNTARKRKEKEVLHY